MKTSKKVLSVLFALTVAIGCFIIPTVDAQAATTKSNTFTYDSSKGVLYEAAARISAKTQGNNETDFYLANQGDYIASVKSNSSNLVAKVCYSRVIKSGNNYMSCYEYGIDNDLKFKSNYSIECYAKKNGNYTLTVTIKNAAKKTTCTKKVKIYATKYSSPFDYISYAGEKYSAYSDSVIVTNKASGKLNYKVNPGYTVKGLYFGTYDANGEIQYKSIKKNSKITLATSTTYTKIDGEVSLGQPDSGYYSHYEDGDIYDYLHPISVVKITYYDKTLKVTRDMIFEFINTK